MHQCANWLSMHKTVFCMGLLFSSCLVIWESWDKACSIVSRISHMLILIENWASLTFIGKWEKKKSMFYRRE